MYSLKDKACIVGVGESTFSRGSGKTDLRLLLDASMSAINDAGLKPHDIDGIIGPPIGATAEHMAANLGIEDLRYATTVHMGGASPVVSLQSAALAVACGIANNVLIPVGWNGYSSNPVRGGGARAQTGAQTDERPMAAANPLQNTIGAYYLPYGATERAGDDARASVNDAGISGRTLGLVSVSALRLLPRDRRRLCNRCQLSRTREGPEEASGLHLRSGRGPSLSCRRYPGATRPVRHRADVRGAQGVRDGGRDAQGHRLPRGLRLLHVRRDVADRGDGLL